MPSSLSTSGNLTNKMNTSLCGLDISWSEIHLVNDETCNSCEYIDGICENILSEWNHCAIKNSVLAVNASCGLMNNLNQNIMKVYELLSELIHYNKLYII